jgi:predicted hydrocarbon binding protein
MGTRPPETVTTGWLINVLINSLHKTTGASFERVLGATPWKRYNNNLPPNDMNMIVVGDEMSLFYARIYEILGPTFYRSFAFLVAQELSSGTAKTLLPEAQKVTTGLAGVARLHAVMPLLSRFWAKNTGIRESLLDNGIAIVDESCAECRFIHSSEPCCFILSDTIKSNMSRLSGLLLHITEAQCRADGKSKVCRFVITLR